MSRYHAQVAPCLDCKHRDHWRVDDKDPKMPCFVKVAEPDVYCPCRNYVPPKNYAMDPRD